MAHVDTTFCPDVERRCLDMEHEEKNNLEICHAFAHEQRCRTDEKRIDFCIDRYEYPNKKGAHPVWMLDWYQAQATCESKGKRLCMASEWTAACEGPDHTPFPYGWERDHDTCNMDNFYIDPKKPGPKAQFSLLLEGPRRRVQGAVAARPERAERLDGGLQERLRRLRHAGQRGRVGRQRRPAAREVASGSRLKGGAWGHVRSQCRPTTYSHEPEFYVLLRRLPLLPRRRRRRPRGPLDARRPRPCPRRRSSRTTSRRTPSC